MGFLVPFGSLVLLLGIGFLVLQATAVAVDRPRKLMMKSARPSARRRPYAEARAAAKAESLAKPAPSWRDNEEIGRGTPRRSSVRRRSGL